jgi:hypothetical protein
MSAGRNRTPVCAVYASSTARALTSVAGALFSQGGASMEARKAYFMVRAEVPNASDRAKFDQWYGTHHLPLAMDKFHCEKGWRFWSRSDASVHYALYQFKDMATLRDRLDSPDFKLLIADFDQAWPGITRNRDLIESVQEA